MIDPRGELLPQREDFRVSEVVEPVGFNGYDHAAFSDSFRTDTGQDTIVQSHAAADADINTIMRRFGATREMPSGVPGGVYGDFTGISNYDDALEVIRRARQGFETLAPEIREMFGNDPGNLIRAVHELPENEVMEMLRAAPPETPVSPVAPVGPEIKGT